MNSKKCPKCGITKPLSEWNKHAGRRNGLSYDCRVCQYTRQKAWYDRIGYKRREEAKLKQYDLTPLAYDQLLTLQAGVCAICNQPEPSQDGRRLAVDHDHVTGRVRGLLCSGCNRGLGIFKENPVYLRKALKYLAKNQGTKLE